MFSSYFEWFDFVEALRNFFKPHNDEPNSISCGGFFYIFTSEHDDIRQVVINKQLRILYSDE